jgi:hypothetical protein
VAEARDEAGRRLPLHSGFPDGQAIEATIDFAKDGVDSGVVLLLQFLDRGLNRERDPNNFVSVNGHLASSQKVIARKPHPAVMLQLRMTPSVKGHG